MHTRPADNKKISFSPPVATKDGHRFIPDDTHHISVALEQQEKSGKINYGFFPQRINQSSVNNEKTNSPSMKLKNPADVF